jgi:DNA-binding MarR family transcriptional regulator
MIVHMEIDVVSAVALAGTALNAEVLGRLAAAGYGDVRVSHGFLLQHVVEGPRPVGEIAERMGITQQAVSKAAAELVGQRYLERSIDPADARVRLLGLSDRGRALVGASRRIRADVEAELAEVLDVEALRTATLAALEWAGGGDALRNRRVPEPD